MDGAKLLEKLEADSRDHECQAKAKLHSVQGTVSDV